MNNAHQRGGDSSYFTEALLSSMSCTNTADEVITALKNKYKMSNLGEVRHFLGLEINRNKDGISLSQGSYIDTLLKWFSMEDSCNVSNPLNPNV
jgi:hypothetical protein